MTIFPHGGKSEIIILPYVLDLNGPPDNWPGVLDHLAIGLVDARYTKLGKIGKKLLLIFGLGHINFPLC